MPGLSDFSVTDQVVASSNSGKHRLLVQAQFLSIVIFDVRYTPIYSVVKRLTLLTLDDICNIRQWTSQYTSDNMTDVSGSRDSLVRVSMRSELASWLTACLGPRVHVRRCTLRLAVEKKMFAFQCQSSIGCRSRTMHWMKESYYSTLLQGKSFCFFQGEG